MPMYRRSLTSESARGVRSGGATLKRSRAPKPSGARVSNCAWTPRWARHVPSGSFRTLTPVPPASPSSDLRAAEFFAGIGLVRLGIESAGFSVVFANDIEPSKHALYAANFDASHFVLGDVSTVHGDDLPDVELATASFPCTDLSLAGWRAGLAGKESSMFWEFARVLGEMNARKPSVVLLENVPSFATSRGGEDLRAAITRLNELGYWCDLLVLNARLFVPQSRPRLFVVGSRAPLSRPSEWRESELRPRWITRFATAYPELRLQAAPLSAPKAESAELASVVQRLPTRDRRWWDPDRVERFQDSLSPLQAERLGSLQAGRATAWATAYRRTRGGRAVWEIRADQLAGCLRTARGGSSKQAVVQAGRGQLGVRWMTEREYARLQGAPNYRLTRATHSQALFGLGDAVCVPVVAWIAQAYLRPLVEGTLTREIEPIAA